jgi:hypothetical protein
MRTPPWPMAAPIYYAAIAVDIYGHESSKTTPVKVTIP